MEQRVKKKIAAIVETMRDVHGPAPTIEQQISSLYWFVAVLLVDRDLAQQGQPVGAADRDALFGYTGRE